MSLLVLPVCNVARGGVETKLSASFTRTPVLLVVLRGTGFSILYCLHRPFETLSIRLQPDTKARLDALSKRSRQSKSCLAVEALATLLNRGQNVQQTCSHREPFMDHFRPAAFRPGLASRDRGHCETMKSRAIVRLDETNYL